MADGGVAEGSRDRSRAAQQEQRANVNELSPRAIRRAGIGVSPPFRCRRAGPRGHIVVTNRAESLNELGRKPALPAESGTRPTRGHDSGPCAGNGVKVQVLSSASLWIVRLQALERSGA
jgi:hypothetical protein